MAELNTLDEMRIALREIRTGKKLPDVMHRYSRAIDRLDLEGYKAAFWEEGGYDGGPAEGPVAAFDPDLFDKIVRSWFAMSQHSVSNIMIDIQGDLAFCELHVTAFHLSHPNHESRSALLGDENVRSRNYPDDQVLEIIVGARYVDNFERRGGEWRILWRREIPEWHPGSSLTAASGQEASMIR